MGKLRRRVWWKPWLSTDQRDGTGMELHDSEYRYEEVSKCSKNNLFHFLYETFYYLCQNGSHSSNQDILSPCPMISYSIVWSFMRIEKIAALTSLECTTCVAIKKRIRPWSVRMHIVHLLPGERLGYEFARVVRRKKPDPLMPSRKSSTVKSLSRGTLEWDRPTRAGSQRNSCRAPGERLKHSVQVVRRKKPDPPKPLECNPN